MVILCHCEQCRPVETFLPASGQVTGITYDGGYADYMIAHWMLLA